MRHLHRNCEKIQKLREVRNDNSSVSISLFESNNIDERAMRFLDNADAPLPSQDKRSKQEPTLKEMIGDSLDDLKKRRDQILLVKVPFFDFSFDINDLGLLSGLSFAVILLLLKFGLRREIANLELIFGEAKHGNWHKDCLKIMSMKQVLTTTDTQEKFISKIWTLMPKILYLLPVIVQYIVAFNDIRTWRFGYAISVPNTNMLFIFHIVILVPIAAFSIGCIRSAFKLDYIWRRERSWDRENNPKEQQGTSDTCDGGAGSS
jgi:hypothetical protein